MTLRSYIVRQFKKPHGMMGALAGPIMASRPSNRHRNRWTVELLDIKPGDRIIEIGCGPGLALEECLAKVADGHVAGVDHSATTLNQARLRTANAIKQGRLQWRNR